MAWTTTQRSAEMKMFVDVSEIYLHKAPVDFRKGINGLSLATKDVRLNFIAIK